MQIASQFASFSYGQADILRRAMSKKNRAVLESERQHFVEGAIKNKYDEKISKQIFDLILKFLIMDFLEHMRKLFKNCIYHGIFEGSLSNYFYANILSNVVGNESKTAAIIDEAKIKIENFAS